jgi:hypothetical protein
MKHPPKRIWCFVHEPGHLAGGRSRSCFLVDGRDMVSVAEGLYGPMSSPIANRHEERDPMPNSPTPEQLSASHRGVHQYGGSFPR